jgi:hypothetical protein
MVFTHCHLNEKPPTVFDCRVILPPNLTYGVLIGRIPSDSHRVSGFYITEPCIMQVPHYLVRPGRQSLIIGKSLKEVRELEEKRGNLRHVNGHSWRS